MPEMDGHETTNRIRKSNTQYQHVPIIALTASVVRSDIDKLREAGMNDYVSKPFKINDLINAIARSTGREVRYIDSRLRIVENSSEVGITNLEYLEQFSQGDQSRMIKYINMFLQSAPEFIHNIENLLGENNFNEISAQIHRNKTKWIMMGMQHATELANQIERKCNEGQFDKGLTEDIEVLLSDIRKATDELGEGRGEG